MLNEMCQRLRECSTGVGCECEGVQCGSTHAAVTIKYVQQSQTSQSGDPFILSAVFDAHWGCQSVCVSVDENGRVCRVDRVCCKSSTRAN